jgi:SAM-dependent methyltransferase
VTFEHSARASSFGTDAQQYDRARPRYPEALVSAVIEEHPYASVLDVGCGTGIASAQLEAHGCTVLGIEPDHRMALVARAKGIEVEHGSFEEWDPRGRQFDVVTSAQAWHWVDPHLGMAKAAGILGPSGRLALFWNQGAYPVEMQPEVEELYKRYAPRIDRSSTVLGSPIIDRIAQQRVAMTIERGFGDPEVRSFPWERTLTSEQWLDTICTHSDHRALPSDQLAALLSALRTMVDANGAVINIAYVAWVVMATKRDL